MDFEKMLKELQQMCIFNELTIINNQGIEINTEENKTAYLMSKLQNASLFAYRKHKGLSKYYTYEMFLSENEYSDIIVNMAYTSLTRIGSEGETMQTANGISRQYESSGLYLLSDLKQIIPKAGGVNA